MIQGFYSASTSLKYRQIGLNVISNNIANINTKGYKNNVASFEDAVYSSFLKEYPDGVSTNYNVGNGTYLKSIERDFSQGRIEETKNNLDIALNGQGFICVLDNNSDIFYTRGGSFSFEPAGKNKKYIVNESGYYLANSRGDKISIPSNINEINIDNEGNIIYDEQKRKLSFKIVTFPNIKGLIAKESGIYKETIKSGEPIKNEDYEVKQGYLEMSNVDIANAMVDLIKNQRLFELNSKVIQTIDGIQSLANNLRK